MVGKWQLKKIGDVCETTSGGTPSRQRPEYYEGGVIPWLKTGELDKKYICNTEEKITDLAIKKSAAKILPENVVLMAMYGATIGKTSITKIQVATNQACCAMIPVPSQLYYEFLYYVLSFKKDTIILLGAGGAQPNISQQIIKDIVIPIPDVEEQYKIAAILTSVDDATEKTTAIIKQTEKVKKGLMQQLLTKGIGHTEFKQTEIGEIPENWEIKSLDGLATKIQDGTHFSPETTDDGYLYVTSKNIRPFKFDLSDVKYVSEEEHRNIYKRCDVKKGDVLLTKDGVNTGNALVNTLDEEFSLLSSVCLIRCSEKLDNGYLCQYLNSDFTRRLIRTRMTGNAIKRLTLSTIKLLKVPVPLLDEQIKISKTLSSIDTKLSTEHQKLTQLQTLKKALMQVLLTGKVRVTLDETEATNNA